MTKLFLIFCMCIFLPACSTYKAFVATAVDPSFSPQRDESVAVVLPNQSTVLERQLLPVLKGELALAHFQTVDDVTQAKWVLAMSANRTDVTYAVSSLIINVNPQLALATPPVRTVPTTTIYLSLFDSRDIAHGKTLALWHGLATALDRDFEAGNNEMIRRMLENYGKNVHKQMRISESRLHKALSSDDK